MPASAPSCAGWELRDLRKVLRLFQPLWFCTLLLFLSWLGTKEYPTSHLEMQTLYRQSRSELLFSINTSKIEIAICKYGMQQQKQVKSMLPCHCCHQQPPNAIRRALEHCSFEEVGRGGPMFAGLLHFQAAPSLSNWSGSQSHLLTMRTEILPY